MRPQARLRCVSWGPTARWAASRPDRGGSRDKSLCPCQKAGENTGFSPVFFLHVLQGYVVHFGSDFWFTYPSTPAAPLSSTQNAPGFVLFGPNRVHFCVFRPFGRAKFWGPFLCILSHSVYRLKSLVIPVRREVSFLT